MTDPRPQQSSSHTNDLSPGKRNYEAPSLHNLSNNIGTHGKALEARIESYLGTAIPNGPAS